MEVHKPPQTRPPRPSTPQEHHLLAHRAAPHSSECVSIPKIRRRWFWHYIQVEFNGFYSLEKLHALQIHSWSSIWRQALVLWAAMLPAVVIALGLEIWPLQNPSLGWERNWSFYARESFRSFILGVTNIAHLHGFIPKLRQPWLRVLPTLPLMISPYVGSLILAAEVSGVFPVPMSTLLALIPGTIGGLSARTFFMRELLSQHPEIKHEFRRFDWLSGFSFSIVVFYCAFGFAFIQAEIHIQVVLSIALYVVKHLVKYSMWKLSHVQGHHDLSVEAVYCGAHVFHTVFSMAFLQNARSHATFGLLLVVGIGHDIAALYSIHQVSKEVHAATRAFLQVLHPVEPINVFDARWTAELLRDLYESSPSSTCRTSARRHPVAPLAVRISPQPASAPASALRHQQAVLVHSVAHLMHCREAMLLRMFVDVFVPIFYLSYVGFLLHGPTQNLPFFPSLANLDDRTFLALCAKLAVPLALKLASFALLCALLRLHRQPSGLAQLAFVVATQRSTMQSWFVASVLQVTSFQLAHMGNDLSFRFTWLHPSPPDS